MFGAKLGEGREGGKGEGRENLSSQEVLIETLGTLSEEFEGVHLVCL